MRAYVALGSKAPKYITSVLSEKGYEVTEFTTGEELSLALEQEAPDLLILDHEIGKGEEEKFLGLNQASRIYNAVELEKRRDDTFTLPIIFYSGTFLKPEANAYGCEFFKRADEKKEILKHLRSLDSDQFPEPLAEADTG